MAIELIGEVNEETKEALRKALILSFSTFAFYEGRFRQIGVSRRDLSTLDPLVILRRLPPLDGREFDQLVDETIRVGHEIVDMETSSGTTGPRKRRAITWSDEASETRFLGRLLAVCGIGPSDSVACMDTDPLTLMVSFAKALELLGAEAYAYSVGHDAESTVRVLARLAPSVIVTVPSILDRYLTPLRRHVEAAGGSNLRRVVYVGEPLSTHTRHILETEVGVEVFAYYGASETSVLGIECQCHDGVHLFTERNIIEFMPTGAQSNRGEVLVTTLQQEGLPLLRYALKDLIQVKDGACPCGLTYPRVEVMGRTDGTAAVLGAQISYVAILKAAYQGVEEPGPMEVILTRNGQEKLTIVLPDQIARDESRIRKALASREPDLAFLMSSGFLALELNFVDESSLGSPRKAQRIQDRRGSGDDVRF